MSPKYLTKAEFARHCGVTPPAIVNAIKKGKVRLSANGFVDASNKKNKLYRASALQRKSATAKGKSEATPALERNPENRQKLKRIELTPDDIDNQYESPAETSNKGFSGMAPNTPAGPDPEYEKTEIDYAIEKMRSTTALNKARLAEMVKSTIRRDFVDKVISLIGTCINDHLITMGDRLSPDIAALADSTEPRVVREIKEAIDEDITSSLEELKTVIQRHYNERVEA